MRPAGRTLAALQVLKAISLSLYFAVALTFLFVSIRTWVYVYDEGFALLNGERVRQGEIPYRDFWTVYPPGQSYALAAVFGLFGSTLAVARTYDTLVRFVLVVGVYLVSKRIANTPIALLAAALVTLWLGTIMFYAYAIFPALALALFALVCLIEYAATGRPRWLAICGALTGVTAVFRADIAVYLAAAVVLAWIPSIISSASGRAMALRAGGAFLGCAAAVAAPFYLYLFLAGGAERVWQALAVFPLTTFRDVRHLPYPKFVPDFALFFQDLREYAHWAQFYLPPTIAVVSAVSVGVALFKSRFAADHKLTGGVGVTVLGGLVFAQALSRYDWIHALPAAIGAALTLGFLVGRLPWAAWKRRLPVAAGAVAALVAVLWPFWSAYGPPSLDSLEDILRYASPWQCHSEIERASCVVLNSNQAQAVEFIRTQTAPDEPIFVGNQRHDLIFVNDVSFYFLAGRPCPTAYHELHPGVATTLPVQQTIARDIEAQEVRWIVLVEWPVPSEPNGSAVSSGVRYLDDWIRAHYRQVVAWGEYTVWNAR